MSELFEKSIRTLELPAVLELLARHAVSDEAKARCLRLRPATDAAAVEHLLDETDAAKTRLGLHGSPSFAGVKDVSQALDRADHGGVLNTRELLDVAGVLTAARRVSDYDAERQGEATAIDRLFSALHVNRYLEDKIRGAILDEETIADTASPELADIRRNMRAAASRGRQILQRIISSPSYAKVLQEALITQRDGRFVVPVKAECKGSLPGLVHDISSSGATLFVEPMGVVQANNELKELQAREEKEIDRVLRILSGECAAQRENILYDYDLLVQLDTIFARAQLSYAMDAGRPLVRKRGGIDLKRARHPLLDPARAVPVTVALGGAYDTLVITGPNTGGKTVTLKTLGLLCLMAQCGLHIPAGDQSAVQVFDRVLADVGDEQSIEQSLSTFSAHMANTVEILKLADEKSLILFDELGAGTDPVEGAALAIAIIQDVRRKGALTAATTHYAELKTFAMTTAGVENASCEFDVQTLRPTYRLLIGIPGKSNAFAISRRLGLPEEIIEDAKGRVGMTSAKLEETIEKLEQTRQILDRERTESARQLRQAEEERKKAAQLRAELEIRLEKSEQKARREAERIVADARAVAESTFRELDAMRSAQNEENDHQRINAARAEMRRKLNETQDSLRKDEPAPEEKKSARAVQVGDVVQIRSMGVKATVLAISSDRTLTLQAGILRVTAREDEVLLLENEKPAVTVRTESRGTALRQSAVSSELDIRGMETIEAIPVVERYIDSAVQSRLETVTIIHGKGTGALRAAVQQSLRRNKQVKSFRLGRYGEGETGVTVVELK